MGIPMDPKLLDFLTAHKPQLETSGVPEHLWRTLYRKLSSDTFDAGETFSFVRLQVSVQQQLIEGDVKHSISLRPKILYDYGHRKCPHPRIRARLK